ncbi:hypothetical protein BDB00DRAFT_888659 [Zychaea mexicana]|uniref:uncharacterized protein n=1 Tax=Zychaea mexicana TaxID=64656 RepID=UPI0022FEC047|nr:uncharacterized protein BDB00DRAFT_888659 [Zychaea mexicana]KAI9488339.1 hypothetical protein BDB00DRAFT_888659 [Zychaea mexicana]
MNKIKSASSSFNSPIPSSLKDECKKTAKILNAFVDPGQGLDKVIPSNILANAQGLAILTVLKAGFLFSGRAGSGLVVARLPDNSWSAPSAIGTAGIGAGGMVGAELTDFVMVLNTKEAVKTFSQFGNITLGGNVSVAAGPLGRNAEAAGSASLKHISSVYSYSKTKGLFAGVSLEGSVIVTRGDANEKFYGKKVSAKELLNGTVPPPSEADALYRALNARFHTLGNTGAMYSRGSMDDQSSTSSPTRSNTFKSTNISAPGTLRQPPTPRGSGQYGPPTGSSGGRAGAPPPYMSSPPPTQPKPQGYTHSPQQQKYSTTTGYQASPPQPSAGGGYNAPAPAPAARAPPPPPPSRKPHEPTARALYDFNGEQGGDLSFREGDIITITEKSGSQDDWWTGTVGGRKGIFPANYVQLQ